MRTPWNACGLVLKNTKSSTEVLGAAFPTILVQKCKRTTLFEVPLLELKYQTRRTTWSRVRSAYGKYREWKNRKERSSMRLGLNCFLSDLFALPRLFTRSQNALLLSMEGFTFGSADWKVISWLALDFTPRVRLKTIVDRQKTFLPIFIKKLTASRSYDLCGPSEETQSLLLNYGFAPTWKIWLVLRLQYVFHLSTSAGWFFHIACALQRVCR